jgi:hypothetical protein
MSSETSTEIRLKPDTPYDKASGVRNVRRQPDPDALQPWQLFTLAGLIGATVVVFISTGHSPAGIILLSLTIFTAAVVGVAIWRTLAPFTVPDDMRPRVVGGRTRAALEREKTLVLRALKDLEFDRAMGKVSEKDFTDMSGRLRIRAAGLMRQLDAGTGYREAIEREIAQRVGTPQSRVARTLSEAPGEPDPATGSGSPRASSRGDEARPTARACAGCTTENDPDARFCKHCGASLVTA